MELCSPCHPEVQPVTTYTIKSPGQLNTEALLSVNLHCYNYMFYWTFSMQSGHADQAKAVFVISEPLTRQSTQTRTLKQIVEASKFQYVIVISTLSPAMHTLIDFGAAEEEMRGFYALEEHLLEWMGNMVCVYYVNIWFTGIIMNCILSVLILTIGCASVYW